ncbi:hypothetical protein GT347_01260 [Xylophilus rhododendri]|uniref:Uncharacterized protein n=1 Tax=Xylophilus rhododendri TaxID=2697032 RepID=A0A857J0M5_9BURK|nr:hypothetical protein [Xylophilus rhododendri]QHI96739.1 hypothetical protein GT347_01260 [Xylophilus rhododendri]
MIKFDVEQDPAFLETLADLGRPVAQAVLHNLFHVAAQLEWTEFAELYDWQVHEREPIDTYPGAVDYYRFTVQLPAGLRPPDDLVDVFCLLYPDVLVICAVAQ